MGGDLLLLLVGNIVIQFQSTPPHGGRHLLCSVYLKNQQFQSTPPHGGRPSVASIRKAAGGFQSTPPHGGRLVIPIKLIFHIVVSIHAPTWGATLKSGEDHGEQTFQSTPPHGGRQSRGECGSKENDVSIHAPTWGATHSWAACPRRCKFQSTPPHGGRLSDSFSTANKLRFNPRPHMGGDQYLHTLAYNSEVSIHAPTWGATIQLQRDTNVLNVSIHAPTWGATSLIVQLVMMILCFNPRPHMGGDFSRSSHSATRRRFNPRPHMGGDFPSLT